MRKRNIEKTADTVFWYMVYLLPLIGYVIYLFAFGQNPSLVDPGAGAPDNATIVSLSSFLSYIGLTTGIQSNVIYNTIWSIFGTTNNNAIFRIASQPLCIYLAYFVSAVLVHLVVDFLLFIPRFAMKYMDEFTKE